MTQEDYDSIIAESVHKISRKYLDTLKYIKVQDDFSTYRDAEREMDKAQITAELCMDILDTIIIRRLDYLIREEVDRRMSFKEDEQNEQSQTTE